MSFSPELIWFVAGLALILSEFMLPGIILVFFGAGAWLTLTPGVVGPISAPPAGAEGRVGMGVKRVASTPPSSFTVERTSKRPSGDAKGSSACASSAMVAKRCARSLAKHWAITASRATGTDGATLLAGVRSPCKIATNMSGTVCATKGSRPVSS